MYQRRVCRVSIPVVAIAVAAGCGGEDYGEDRFENVYQVQLVDGDARSRAITLASGPDR